MRNGHLDMLVYNWQTNQTKPVQTHFRKQNGRMESIRAYLHVGRECLMRLEDDRRLILYLGCEIHVGGRFSNDLKSIIILFSVEVTCKSSVAEFDSVKSVTFKGGSNLHVIENECFSRVDWSPFFFHNPWNSLMNLHFLTYKEPTESLIYAV
jgi:hypothetical protein